MNLGSFYRQGAWALERLANTTQADLPELAAALAEEQASSSPRPWLLEALRARIAALGEDGLTIETALATEPEQCTRCLAIGITELTIFPGDRYYRLISAARTGYACADCFARLQEEAAAS